MIELMKFTIWRLPFQFYLQIRVAILEKMGHFGDVLVKVLKDPLAMNWTYQIADNRRDATRTQNCTSEACLRRIKDGYRVLNVNCYICVTI